MNIKYYIYILILGACGPVIFASAADTVNDAQPEKTADKENVLSVARFEYDGRDRLKSLYGPGNRKTTLHYNKRGQIKFVVKGKIKETFEYDRLGFLKSFKDKTGKTLLEHDAGGRLKLMTYPGGDSVGYQYTQSGMLISVTWDDRHFLNYIRDLLGNIVKVSTPAGIFDISYDYNTQKIQRKYPNGAFSQFVINAEGKTKTITHALENGEVVLQFDYTYYDSGLLKTVKERSRNGEVLIMYSYDAHDQLLTAVYSDGRKYTYDYDMYGNLEKVMAPSYETTLAYKDNDQLKSINDEQVNHDPAGNIINMGGRKFTYNYDNAPTNDGLNQYQYNAMGLRVAAKGSQESLKFIHLINEFPYVLVEKGKTTKQYLWADGNLLGQITNDKEVLFFFEDHLGTIRAAVDASGNIINYGEYSPFGVPIKRISNVRFGFAGEEQDEEGRVYLRARYYEPKIARFLSKDPVFPRLMDEAKQNRYAYAANSPINYKDMNGNQATPNQRITPTFDQVQQYLNILMEDPNLDLVELTQIVGQEKYIWPLNWDVQSIYIEGVGSVDMNYMVSQIFQPRDYYGNSLKFLRDMTLPLYVPFKDLFHDAWMDQGKAISNDFSDFKENALGEFVNLGAMDLFQDTYSVFREDFKQNYKNWVISDHGMKSTVSPRTTGEELINSAFIMDAEMEKKLMDRYWPNRHEYEKRNSGRTTSDSSPSTPGSGKSFIGPRLQGRFLQQSKALTDHIKSQVGTMRGIQSKDDISGGSGHVAGPVTLPSTGFLLALNEVRAMQGYNTPNVGGVYLDKVAEVIGNLSNIVGSTFDSSSNRLILIGRDDSSTNVPPLNIEDLATAYRSVFGNSSKDPGVTIDPNPDNPLAESMLVRFFGDVENTRFGYALFEADRQMKGLSLGEDNISHAKVKVGVEGYYNLLNLGFSDLAGTHNNNLWSRFWLVPELVIVQASEDNNSITFPDTSIRIKTDTMRWKNGKLVPEKKVKNKKAEYFAAHFTKNYDEYAKELPVFGTLKNLTNMVALFKWIKKSGLQVKLDWLEIYNTPYETPTLTPSLTVHDQRRADNGVMKLSIFGGTDLTFKNRYFKDDSSTANLAKKSLKAVSSTTGLGFASFKDHDKSTKTVIALPTSQTRIAGAKLISESELGLLSRVYCSFHNERREFGHSWQLDLPRLHISRPQRGKKEYISENNQTVEVKEYRLTRSFGMVDVSFGRTVFDHQTQRIAFLPQIQIGIRALYPGENDEYQIEYNNGRKETFDSTGRIKRSQNFAAVYHEYNYNNKGDLVELNVIENENRVSNISLTYDDAGRIKTAKIDGKNIEYAYNARGELITVNVNDSKIEYEYNEKHLVTKKLVNDKEISSLKYDNYGRVRSWSIQGKNIYNVKYKSAGTNTTISGHIGKNTISKRYDSGGRLLMATFPSGLKITADYYDDGNLKQKTIINKNGDKSVIEYSPDRRYVKRINPENGVVGILRDNFGRLKKVDDGDIAILEKTYVNTKEGWMEMTETPDLDKEIIFDTDMEVKILSLKGKSKTVGQLRLINEYDKPGELKSIEMEGMLTGKINYYDGKIKAQEIGGKEIEYDYHSTGKITSVKSSGRELIFLYDKNGFLKEINLEKGGYIRRHGYKDEKLIFRHNEGGLNDTFTYNNDGRLKEVIRGDGEKWTIMYGHRNKIINRNGIKHMEFAYDEKGRLSELRY